MTQPGVLHITSLPGGGVDRHVRDIASATARRHLVWHTADTADLIEVIDRAEYLPLDREALEHDAAILAGWLREENVGIVHAHSLNRAVRKRASWAAQALGVRTIVTLHDILFLRREAFEPGAPRSADPAWLGETAPFLRAAGAVVAPSEYIASLARANIAGLEVAVVPNGIGSAPARSLEARPEFSARRPQHAVAVVGAIGPHKGSDLLMQLDPLLAGSGIAIVVIGYLDRQVFHGWFGEHLYVHGAYNDVDLGGLLRAYGIELALFPNTVPESFSYTLSEVWRAGVPVLVSPEGALAERVSRHGGGWVLPERFDATAIDARLRGIFSQEGRTELGRVKSQLAQSDHERVPTLDAMALPLDAIYRHYGISPGPLDMRSAPVQQLLAKNLDGALFRPELVKIVNELMALNAEARPWIRKLEADIASLQAELTAEVEQRRALGQENAQLRIHKAAFDLLPGPIRKWLLKRVIDARS